MCVKCEGSMINDVGRRDKYRKNEKYLPLKNIGHIDLIFHSDIVGHMCKM